MNQKFTIALNLLALSLIALAAPAFAIDQITLSNGQVVEGKILNDVPNRYIDIELVNGTKKRYQKSDIATSERDVPSTKDTSMMGSESRMYVGGLLGVSMWKVSGTASTYTQFAYGARFGVNGAQLGDFGKLAFGLSFDRFSISYGTLTTVSQTSVLAQILVRKVSNSGFYFGPELGLGIGSTSTLGFENSNTAFEIGGVAGYDYYATSGFSFGPEVHYDNYGASSIATSNAWKFLMSGTIHFE